MKKLLLIAPALLLAGCISLLPEPPPAPRLFVLEAGDVQRIQGAPVESVIAVAAPQGARALLGSDLLWRTGPELAYVGGAEWSGRGQEGLQVMVVQTMSRQGRVRAVVRSGAAAAQYEVRWDLLRFEIDGDAMRARFSAAVNIVEYGSRRVIATELVETEAPVASRSASLSAEALARAAREGSARIGLFAADAVAAADAAKAAQAAAAEAQPNAASIRR